MKRLFAVIVWLLLYSSTFGMEAWESNYTRLLQKYVKTSGVSYSVWKENSADVQALKEIINQIGASGPSSQEREAQLAYYINAYNALVLAGVLDRYPLRSVRDVAPFYGFFTQNNITVAGNRTSLYALERKLLIPRFQEPCIHFAINCASRSCPLSDQRPSSYTTYRQFVTLDRWVRRFSAKEFHPVSPIKFLRLAFSSPVYSWIDMVNLPLGFLYWVLQFFQHRFYEIDLFVRVPKLLIPVYFFQGRYDHLLSASVAERYFQNLEAPSGKRLVWFENSGHWPQLEQAKKYREEIQSVLLAQKRKKTDRRCLSR